MQTQASKQTERTRGVLAWIIQLIIATAAAGVLLFLSAGRLDWTGGWVFFGLNLFTQMSY